MKVYIIFQVGIYDSEEIVVVFSSKKVAKEEIKKGGYFSRIEEYEVIEENSEKT